jgi:hypothetical protein
MATAGGSVASKVPAAALRQDQKEILMERKASQFKFQVARVVAMVAFLSAVSMAGAPLSQAASGKGKSTVAAKTAVEHTESRIKQLKGALNITEDQEPLWNNMTQVMRDNAKDMDALSKVRAEKAKTMNALEQMRFHSQMTEAQLDQQKKFIPVFEALYLSMSDEQKTATDAVFRTGRHGKHRIK